MSVSMEAHRDKLAPLEWQRLLKVSAIYAQSFEMRVCGEDQGAERAGGEEILRLTLSRIAAGCEGYAFRDGDILFFHYLCRCCRRTVLGLHPDKAIRLEASLQPAESSSDTPAELTEQAALAFLERRNAFAGFQAFTRERKLRGKLRAYCVGLAKYAADRDPEWIARDLRITVGTLGRYRSRLRELLEDFESERIRRRLT